MPREIDETKLNYNKYPGEHVIEFEGVVTIGGDKTYHLVQNFREGFDAQKLEQRFSDVFDKYDYLVGDWGFEQLRLKGFFSTSRKKMDAASKIDHLEDYLNEFCNYGAPYFVLRRIRAKEMKKKEAFTSERAFEDGERQGKLEKPRRRRNRNRKKPRIDSENESLDFRDKNAGNFSQNSQNKGQKKSKSQKFDPKLRKDNDFSQSNQASKKPKKRGNHEKERSDLEANSRKRTTDKTDKNARFEVRSNKPEMKNSFSTPHTSASKNQTPKQQGFVIRTRDEK